MKRTGASIVSISQVDGKGALGRERPFLPESNLAQPAARRMRLKSSTSRLL